MQCGECQKQVPEGARFCPFCSAALSAQAEAGQPDSSSTQAEAPASPQAPVSATAPPAANAPKGKSTKPWMVACGISCAVVFLLVIIGVGAYLGLRMVRERESAAVSEVMEEGVLGAGTAAEDFTHGSTSEADPATTSSSDPGLAGEWDIVYWGGEGDLPRAVSLRAEGDLIVGEVIGRYETHIEMRSSGSVRWTGTFSDFYRPDGIAASIVMSGRDRIRLIDEDMPDKDIILVADRPNGSDFGPHPRANTEAQAADAVAAHPEVAAWMQQIERAKAEGRKTGARFEIEEDLEDCFVVHVFEMVEDEGGGGHSATFGRYLAWKDSGVVVLMP